MINTITAGDSLNFLTPGGEYPASDGWSLVYKLIPRTAGPSVISISSTAEGADHRIDVVPATTAAWAAGSYSWACYALKTGQRKTLQTGNTQILPDPAVVAILDNRSSARKALEAANAALETYGHKAFMQSYSINGRAQSFQSPSEFMAWRSRLQAEVAREDNAEAIRAGMSPRNLLRVRFNAR